MAVKLHVGRQQIRGNLNPTEAAYTRKIIAQMAGIRKGIEEVIHKIQATNADALLYATKPIFDLSQRYVPKDTLALMRSGYHETTMRGKLASVSIGYAKGGVPHYGVYVHERLELKHANGTRAKFLESAANEKKHLIVRRYRDYMKRNVGI